MLQKIKSILLNMAIALAGLGIISETLDQLYGADVFGGFVPLFNLLYECNIPTWYSSALLLFCALALAVIAITTSGDAARYKRHWGVLSAIFCYISMDETATIHERINTPLREFLGVGGALYYSWVIPTALILVLLAIFYWGFLLALEERYRKLFLLAGFIYVAGAFGTEFIISDWYVKYGLDPGYGFLNVIQEMMEISGLSIFLYSLLLYLADHARELRAYIE